MPWGRGIELVPLNARRNRWVCTGSLPALSKCLRELHVPFGFQFVVACNFCFTTQFEFYLSLWVLRAGNVRRAECVVFTSLRPATIPYLGRSVEMALNGPAVILRSALFSSLSVSPSGLAKEPTGDDGLWGSVCHLLP